MLNTARNIISSDATTQKMIAPVINTLVATKTWSVGDEFIYAGVLYKVISAIAIGDTIVLGSGGNADTASTISEEAYRINDATETDIADGDYFPFYDVSAGKKRKSLWSTLIAKIKSALATVATSGSYTDLSNKPTIPTVNNGTLTIQRNGSNVATFTANQSGNSTANISVPINQAAASGGTTVSACTTGEKFNWNSKVSTSTSSFKAIDPAGATTSTTYIGGVLDAKVHAVINSFTSGASTLLYLSNGGPVYGAILTKTSNSYYSGLIWGYHNDSTYDAAYVFGYRNGTYFIRPLAPKIR